MRKLNKTEERRMKRWRIVSCVVYPIIALLVIVLAILGAKKIISDWIDLVAIIISFFAVALTVLENNVARENEHEQKFTQFVIDNLQKIESQVSDLLGDTIKNIEMQQEIAEQERQIAPYFLKAPVYKEKMEAYFIEYSGILSSYYANPKNLININDIINKLFQFKANFEVEMNELIKKLYTGEEKVTKDKKQKDNQKEKQNG